MIIAFLQAIRYKISIIYFNVRFNIFGSCVAASNLYLTRAKIMRRLIHNGIDKKRVSEIMDRYFIYRVYLQKKETREARLILMNFISEWAKENNMTQWDAREMISRDFHLDI